MKHLLVLLTLCGVAYPAAGLAQEAAELSYWDQKDFDQIKMMASQFKQISENKDVFDMETGKVGNPDPHQANQMYQNVLQGWNGLMTLYLNFYESHKDVPSVKAFADTELKPLQAWIEAYQAAMVGGGVFEEALKDEFGPLGHIAQMEAKLLGDEKSLYEDASGVNPNQGYRTPPANAFLREAFEIETRPVHMFAMQTYFQSYCEEERKMGGKSPLYPKKQFETYPDDVAALYAALPDLWDRGLTMYDRWISYTGLAQNLRDDVIFAPSDMRHTWVASKLYDVDEVKETAKKFDNCPNAPGKISDTLIPMIDAHVDAVVEFMEPHLERELVDRIKDKRMPANNAGVSSADRSSFGSMARRLLGDRKVKTLRFPHGWSSRKEKVWQDNREIYINEDWATIWAYTDPGPDVKYYDCYVLDAVKDKNANGRPFVRWSYNANLFCYRVLKSNAN